MGSQAGAAAATGCAQAGCLGGDNRATSSTKMLSSCFRSLFAKVAILIWLIVAVDQVFRQKVVLAPGQVAERYMAALRQGGSFEHERRMTVEERSSYVRAQCASESSDSDLLTTKHKDNYFFLKSKNNDVKNVLLCIPQRMASKAAFDVINEAFDYPCYKGSKGELRDCAVNRHYKPENNSLKVVFTRHPFDRLIIEYRHQKSVETEVQPNSRKLLFSRHRNWKKRSKKGSHQFREFIKNSVLGPNSTVFPVSQVCSVCHQKYDIVYNLDDGLEHIGKIIEMAGSEAKHTRTVETKMKVVGPKVQRKFFSEMTANEIEPLYIKFKDDFLLFGYSLDFYKNMNKT